MTTPSAKLTHSASDKKKEEDVIKQRLNSVARRRSGKKRGGKKRDSATRDVNSVFTSSSFERLESSKRGIESNRIESRGIKLARYSWRDGSVEDGLKFHAESRQRSIKSERIVRMVEQ